MSAANNPPFYADTPLALLSTPAFLTGKVNISFIFPHVVLWLNPYRRTPLQWERLT
jgi:hypothetical protein